MEEYARQFRRDIQERYPKKFRVIKDYRVLQYEVDNILVEKGDKAGTIEKIIEELKIENGICLDTTETRATIEMCIQRYKKQVLFIEITR